MERLISLMIDQFDAAAAPLMFAGGGAALVAAVRLYPLTGTATRRQATLLGAFAAFAAALGLSSGLLSVTRFQVRSPLGLQWALAALFLQATALFSRGTARDASRALGWAGVALAVTGLAGGGALLWANWNSFPDGWERTIWDYTRQAAREYVVLGLIQAVIPGLAACALSLRARAEEGSAPGAGGAQGRGQ